MTLPPTRAERRVRHELRYRLLEVLRAHRPTPGVCRVVLGGPEFAGFFSPAPDDHVKLFFPAPGARLPVLPEMTPEGPRSPEGAEPIARYYTPRRFSETELEIDFVLHGAGPAANWAAQVAPGQVIGVGGPRHSCIMPPDLEWLLLVGDETALPAIARFLSELPPTTRALVLAEVANEGERQPLPSAAPVQLTWVLRGDAEPGQPRPLATALAALRLPPGSGHAWVAAEVGVMRELCQQMQAELALPRERIEATGYWRRDPAGGHASP